MMLTSNESLGAAQKLLAMALLVFFVIRKTSDAEFGLRDQMRTFS